MMLKIGFDTGTFTPTKGDLLAREEMMRDLECSAFDPGGAASTIERASAGDPDARIAVHTAIAAFAATEQPIPVALQPYLFHLLNVGAVGPKKRGVKRSNRTRDQWLVVTIKAITEYGFDPTRNPATADKGGTEFACSILVDELKRLGGPLEEAALNKIWSRRASSD